MGLLTKDDQLRLTETFKYMRDSGAPKPQIDLLSRWVYFDGIFSSKNISKALSLDVGVMSKLFSTSSSQRHAVRATMLARLAAEDVKNLNVTRSWKDAYLKKKESELKNEMMRYLGRLTPKSKLPATKPTPTPTPASYGVGKQQLAQAISGLKGIGAQPKVGPSTPPPLLAGASHAAKIKHFDQVSRVHVVLSGHGSWMYNPASRGWPSVTLGQHQRLCCYVKHYYPLGNDVGQLVDNRRFPPPVDEFPGGSRVPDYTLQPKDKLVLLNHSIGDTNFITVKSNTLLSTFLRRSEYAAATFHWAACRVVFNEQGQLYCPVHSRWEDFGGSAPTPCVLT
jgi:hypothetical protein